MDPEPTGADTVAPAPWPPGRPILEYSNARMTRPGLLTVVGVISIVYASLGLLRSLWQMVSFVGMLIMSQITLPAIGATGGGMTPAGALTAADAAVIVAALDGSQALSPTDQTRLAAALQRADIPLAPPPAGQPWTQAYITTQLTSPAAAGSGTTSTRAAATFVTYQFSGGTIEVDPSEITFVVTASGVSTTTVDNTGGVSSFKMDNNPFSGISVPLLVTGFATELLNLGLAVLLLVAGILTLRGSHRAPVLHEWWAWLKLAAVVISAVVGIWMTLTMLEGFGMTVTQARPNPAGGTTVTTPLSSMRWLMVIPAVAMALVGLIYPIFVLIAFRTRRIREHYAAASGQR